MNYTNEQKAEAVRLQMAYRGKVKAAWSKVEEAQRKASREVDEAQAMRDASLRLAGIDPNDMRAIRRGTMTIDEMIEQLTLAKEYLPMGGQSEVKLASGSGRSLMRYAIADVSVKDVTEEEYIEEMPTDPESICWLVEGAQDYNRPYSVPTLASIESMV